jgi:hypothetical protein
MPFGRQPAGAANPEMFFLLVVGGLAVGIAIALQYFLIFRSPAAVLAVTVVLCGAAWLLARSSLEAFEIAIRFNLGLLSNESKGIYTEVNG